MTVTEKIIESVRDNRLTAAQIITQLDAKPATIKSTLHRLVKDERVLRTKEAVRAGRGPQQVFVYYIKQQESSKEIISNIRAEGGYPPIYL